MSQNSTTIGADRGYEPRAFRRFFADLGPGLITGAADDDPSGISTYSIAGAALGYAPLWTALFSFPLMASVQLMCARVGMVTGLGLAGVIRRRYPLGAARRVRAADRRQRDQHRRRSRRNGRRPAPRPRRAHPRVGAGVRHGHGAAFDVA